MTVFTEEIDQQVVVEKKEADSQNDISDEVLENKFQLVRLRPSSLERIAHILQDAGYKAKISGDENFRFIISGTDGWNFKITFHDDAPAGIETRQVSFQFSSGWTIQAEDLVKISEAANAFNRQYRYAKAFVGGNEGYAYTEVEMSHFCYDGVSDDAFISYLELFFYLRRTYVDLCKTIRSQVIDQTGK